MIPPANLEPNNARDSASWREELRTALRSSAALLAALGLKETDLAGGCAEAADFPVLVPRGFVARMRYADPADPLLRQVIALASEHVDAPGFVADPLQERAFAADGVLTKYAHRALLITTAACPLHCRYCFRRHFPYDEQLAARSRFAAALALVRQRPDIEEVILSGGDPLSLSTGRLTELVGDLEAIETVTTVRIHTRFPVVVPARVTDALLRLLEASRLQTVVVVHCNHPNELAGPQVTSALHRLSRSVDLLLNQAVLLRGVNDSVATLAELSKALLRARVKPYYLHLLDRIAGSAHFDVPEAEAVSLLQQLRRELPGYLLPRLVRENAGEPSKTPLA